MEILLTLIACFSALAIDHDIAYIFAYAVTVVCVASIIWRAHILRNE